MGVEAWETEVEGRRSRLPFTGTTGLTLGFLAVAFSAALLLAAGPRLVSKDAFSGVSLVWTISVVFGLGIGGPTEQLISRRMNALIGSKGWSPERWLGVSAALGVAAIAGADLVHAYPFAGARWACLALVAWSLAAPARGRLLGRGAQHRYAVSLLAEAGTRVVLVGAAGLVTSMREELLMAAVGVPILVAAIVARSRTTVVGEAVSTSRTPKLEQGAFVLILLGYQICLSLPAIVIAYRVTSSQEALVGAFVVTSSWFRAPAVLLGGINVSALASLSRAFGKGDAPAFRRELERAVRACLITAIAAVTFCYAIAQPAVDALYGAKVELPHGTYVALAVSTVLGALSAVLSMPLMALGRAWSAAVIWGVASVLLVVGQGVLPLSLALTVGLIGPVAFTAVVLSLTVRHATREFSGILGKPVGPGAGEVRGMHHGP